MEDGSISEWVIQAAAGDQRSWDALVTRFTPVVWAVARAFGLSSSDAADVCQATWLRLVERLAQVREPDRVGAWLATTARRESLALLRRAMREPPYEDVADRGDPRADPEGDVMAAERHAAVWRALNTLPEKCRRLLRLLAATPPPTYEQVAAVMAMPIGSIGPTRARCLRRLRAVLSGAPRVGEGAPK